MEQDRLRLGQGDLTRVGKAPDASNPILGEWLAKREISGRAVEARYFFYPAGKCLLLLPFVTKAGRYSIHDATMRLELGDQKPIEGKFQVEGDLLTLPSPSSSPARFRRY